MTRSLIYLIAIFALWFYIHITNANEKKAKEAEEDKKTDISIADELVPNFAKYSKGQVTI